MNFKHELSPSKPLLHSTLVNPLYSGKILLCIFSKTYKLWCIEVVLYWCKYHFLAFLDKWRQATVGKARATTLGKAGWIFNGFLMGF